MTDPNAAASYREPLEPPPSLDPLDAALAREIYERQSAEKLENAREEREKEEKKQRAEAAMMKKRRRRPRRAQLENASPYPFLIVKKSWRDDTESWVVLFWIWFVAVAFPGGLIVGGMALDSLAMYLTAAGLAAPLLPFAIWLTRICWLDLAGDLMRLRVTPHHFELQRNGWRHAGERDELVLSVHDDYVDVRDSEIRFHIDALHPADVELITRYWLEMGLKRS